jgi:hypothetical protein
MKQPNAEQPSPLEAQAVRKGRAVEEPPNIMPLRTRPNPSGKTKRRTYETAWARNISRDVKHSERFDQCALWTETNSFFW